MHIHAQSRGKQSNVMQSAVGPRLISQTVSPSSLLEHAAVNTEERLRHRTGLYAQKHRTGFWPRRTCCGHIRIQSGAGSTEQGSVCTERDTGYTEWGSVHTELGSGRREWVSVRTEQHAGRTEQALGAQTRALGAQNRALGGQNRALGAYTRRLILSIFAPWPPNGPRRPPEGSF